MLGELRKRKPGQKRQQVKGERVIGTHKISKEPVDYGVTKKQFFEVLDRASQEIKKPESDSEKAQTSGFRHSDDCNGKYTR